MAVYSKKKISTREGWVGEFDWGFLCTPTLNPWSKTSPRSRREVPFYGLNDKLPILLALVCGFQHSLAMLVRGTGTYAACPSLISQCQAGVITPPTIFASQLGLNGTPYAVYMCARTGSIAYPYVSSRPVPGYLPR